MACIKLHRQPLCLVFQQNLFKVITSHRTSATDIPAAWLTECYLYREARRAALQASLAEKEAAEKAGHNYKANPVPAHLHNPSLPALPEPSFTVNRS